MHDGWFTLFSVCFWRFLNSAFCLREVILPPHCKTRPTYGERKQDGKCKGASTKFLKTFRSQGENWELFTRIRVGCQPGVSSTTPGQPFFTNKPLLALTWLQEPTWATSWPVGSLASQTYYNNSRRKIQKKSEFWLAKKTIALPYWNLELNW